MKPVHTFHVANKMYDELRRAMGYRLIHNIRGWMAVLPINRAVHSSVSSVVAGELKDQHHEPV